MLKLKEVKEVSKVSIEREKVIEKAVNACNDIVNGKRNASYMLNILINNGFSGRDIRTVSKDTASEKQMKAIEHLIHGRHYAKSVFNDLIQFLNYPDEFNKVIPVKEKITFTNTTSEEVMKVFEKQNGISGNEVLTEKEKEESLKNF